MASKAKPMTSYRRNISYEQLPASNQDLSFECLKRALEDHLGLESFGQDTLKTLGLFSDDSGYNNAAAILADKSTFPGIDLARFGENINVITRRVISEGKSALEEFDEALQVFDDLYCYEEIVGERRRAVETIPVTAFREALSNALIHRVWDVNSRIRIAMFDDRIELTSPGGLPPGVSEEEYLNDQVSVRRNPILTNVFFRLGLIEAFGTGILRIRSAYADSSSKPRFRIMSNSITVILPVFTNTLDLNADQQQVYNLLSAVREIASSEILAQVSFGRSKLNRILNELIDLGLVATTGNGRGTKYRRA